MEERPLKLIQVSDIHLFGKKDKALLDVRTEESFQAILDLIQKDTNPADLIILSGDITQDASPEAYRRVAELMSQLKVPVYCIPGNHDDSQVMSKIYPLENVTMQRSIVLKQWQIILLDSHIHRSVEGHLAKDQFEFLQEALESNPEHHAMIVFHHQPIPVGSVWLDKIGLTNADELWQFLTNYPQVRTILFGHVHQIHEGKKNGISYYSLPSCCIQFKPDSEDFALDNIPPGYRWIELYPDGQLKTGICRLPDYIGRFDGTAKGY